MSIEIRNVTKRFGSFTALDDISLEVPTGQLVALLGPSGSGKTTLLRAIAGLDPPDRGEIRDHGTDVTRLGARDRNVGFVFQHFARFPHLDVFENIAFALRIRKRPDAEVRERVHELVSLIQLQGMEHRRPAELSGGQRQRVALARALAAKPRVLLLDEPFSALDARVRQGLRRWLRRLHDELGTTCIFVTHDQEEAFELADNVVVFEAGRVAQLGSPAEVYQNPGSAFVADFLGHANRFDALVHDGQLHLLGQTWPRRLPDGPASVFVRHSDVEIAEQPPTSLAAVAVRVARVVTNGPRAQAELRTKAENALILADLIQPRERALAVGSEVWAVPRRLHAFAVEAGQMPRSRPTEAVTWGEYI